MLKTIKFLGVFTILFSAMCLFSSNTAAYNNPNQTLFGTKWKLIKINGQKVSIDRTFIKFDESKNSISGNGGCNNFGGSMNKKGKQIKFSNVFSTKMYCESVQQIEDTFFSNIDKVTNYEVKKGKLYLKANNNNLLEFNEQK